MASVFLSYDHDDAKRARPIAIQLEKAGHSVWWDLHVRGGAQFSKVIEEALKAADVVVVLWSKDSVESAWVRDEAAAGRDTGRLVPVTIDGTEPPMGFRQFQTINLARWRGRGTPAELAALLNDVRAIAESSATQPPAQPARAARLGPAVLDRRFLLGLSAAFALLVAGALYWRLIAGRGGTPTVAIAAADNSFASRNMADKLLIDLGNLQSAKSRSMTLVSGSDNARAPDLLVQAADTSTAGNRSATLAVIDGSSRGLLWSKDFQAPSGNTADLKQQLAFTAAGVLGCALDGLTQDRVRLNRETLKTYLGACAQLSGLSGGDPRPVASMLQQVTRDAPRFAPAWAKLLIAQAAASDLAFTNGVPEADARSQLRQSIDSVRKRFPGMPEAELAEAVLLPPSAYGKKLELINRAARHSPDNPEVMTFRSAALQSVGRMGDAIDSAQRAVDIDPLSPRLAARLVYALAYAGYVDSARDQLAQVEKLWPDSAIVDNLYYTFNFRYGDPKIALAMDQTKNSTAGVPYFLQARIDPSAANVQRLVTFLRGRKDRFRESAGSSRLVYYMLAMATFHQDDELFDTLAHWFRPSDFPVISDSYFRPELHDFRRQPRFLRIMKAAGLVDYWQQSGKWPDFCFETDMPYDCKKEAAKLTA